MPHTHTRCNTQNNARIARRTAHDTFAPPTPTPADGARPAHAITNNNVHNTPERFAPDAVAEGWAAQAVELLSPWRRSALRGGKAQAGANPSITGRCFEKPEALLKVAAQQAFFGGPPCGLHGEDDGADGWHEGHGER